MPLGTVTVSRVVTAPTYAPKQRHACGALGDGGGAGRGASCAKKGTAALRPAGGTAVGAAAAGPITAACK